jgi:flagellar biosynthesis protein FlhB
MPRHLPAKCQLHLVQFLSWFPGLSSVVQLCKHWRHILHKMCQRRKTVWQPSTNLLCARYYWIIKLWSIFCLCLFVSLSLCISVSVTMSVCLSFSLSVRNYKQNILKLIKQLKWMFSHQRANILTPKEERRRETET